MIKTTTKLTLELKKNILKYYYNLPKMLNLVEENPKLHFIFNEKKQVCCAYLELAKDYILTIKNNQKKNE